MDNTTNKKNELEKLTLEEIQNKIKKVEKTREDTIKKLSKKISYDICDRNGWNKGFIKYLKKQEGFKIEWSFPIFSKEEIKRIRKLRYSLGTFWYKIKEHKETVEILEKVIPYCEPYLKQEAIEEFCKLHPKCYDVLLEKPEPKMVRPKKCQYCGVKIKKRNTCCHECGVKVELVEVGK